MSFNGSTDRVKANQSKRQVVIIGSGVIGLTAALELRSLYEPNDMDVTIIARDMPHDGLDSTGWASPWAGANWFPTGSKERENRWETISWNKFKTEVPKEFIKDVPGRYYSRDKDQQEVMWYGDVVGDLKVIPEPWPESVGNTPYTAAAFEFTTFSIAVPAYLCWLQGQLTHRGVRFVKGWVSSIADLEYVPGSNGKIKTDIVVNASGLGAKHIIGVEDDLVLPIRGQTVLVRAPEVTWSLMGMSFYVNKETSETTYMIPRENGDVILGGTFQEGRWDVSPDADTARGILERALKYCSELASKETPEPGRLPDISDIKVLRHNVGLRPARRTGARVEKEIVEFPTTKSPWKGMNVVPNALNGGMSIPSIDSVGLGSQKELSMRVVHAYGVGPFGYQQSWGVAADVTQLVGDFLTEMQ